MKTMADILRERGKLGPYPAPAEAPPEPAPEKPARKRPREPLPPVDF